MKPAHFILSAAILAACGAPETASEENASLPAQAVQTAQNTSEISDAEPTQAVEVAAAKEAQDSGSEPEKSTQSEAFNSFADPEGLTELNWQDLMPVGEDEVLAELYEAYYTNLRQDIAARSQLLQDPNNTQTDEDDFDVSVLISEGATNDTMEQIGTFNVVKELDGLNVRLPGYVVPLDFNSDGVYTEFLLVPYFGACLHTPPPPPNQIVFVKANPGAKVASINEPVWVEGVMKTGKFESETGDSAYELSLSNLEVYDY